MNISNHGNFPARKLIQQGVIHPSTRGGPGGPLTRNLQLSSCWLPATGNKLLSDVHRLPPAKTIRVEKCRKGLSTPTISLWSEDAALVFFEIFFLRIQDMGTCSLDWRENHKYWHSKGASSIYQTLPSDDFPARHVRLLECITKYSRYYKLEEVVSKHFLRRFSINFWCREDAFFQLKWKGKTMRMTIEDDDWWLMIDDWWMIDWWWVNYWLIDWLIDWLLDWLTDWLIVWLIDWLTDWLIDWFDSIWLIVLIDWLIDWLIVWLFDCLFVWLIDWLFDSSTHRLIDSWTHWLIDSLTHYWWWWWWWWWWCGQRSWWRRRRCRWQQ